MADLTIIQKLIRLFNAWTALEATPEYQELKAALEDLGIEL